jgi:medium-chain acyl-[acyl-carrier-protein] hydrolase
MRNTFSNSVWINCQKPNPAADMRLFCFPYAGGGAGVFREWPKQLPATVEVCAVKLPGRGTRLHEPAYTSLPPLVEAIAEGLAPHLRDKPFAFFGHSMGALVGFELARLLRGRGEPSPAHLFVSGSRAPHLPTPRPHIYALPEAELIEELRRLGGTPREVLEHPELMQLMLPIIRADFSVCQTYAHREGPPLDCPVTAFGGLQDEDIEREHVAAWRRQTTSTFSARMLPGDHFFLHTAQPQLLTAVAGELYRLAVAAAAR